LGGGLGWCRLVAWARARARVGARVREWASAWKASTVEIVISAEPASVSSRVSSAACARSV